MILRSPSPIARVLGAIAALLIALASLGLWAGPANAANIAFSQCNDYIDAAPGGGITAMDCTVEIVNVINGPNRSSTLTVKRNCLGGVDNACPGGSSNAGAGNTGSVPVTTTSSNLITTVNQCNRSANDTAIMTPPVRCTVRITNRISADTPGARSPATLNQCNDTTATADSTGCVPASATTTGATVTQCNESGQGGGGFVDCSFALNSNMNDPVSKVSSALPIAINQCNRTGNAGGSRVVCQSFITTEITAAFVTPTASPTTSPTTPVVSSGEPPQVTFVPHGGVATGGGSTSGLQHTGLLALGVTLLGAAGLLLQRRAGRRAS